MRADPPAGRGRAASAASSARATRRRVTDSPSPGPARRINRDLTSRCPSGPSRAYSDSARWAIAPRSPSVAT